ncbi:MarR family protein [Shimia sp. SK013]|uniref:MarR family winged helix-turn-helix transcriptional regulator n=1 Tax=Shimia sp. SK013 TaxID=1389006 RepID=UPI0006B5342D|nr:MarR family transcriptional regulator [Shimia sp. SK013]KPA20427.1 MarR family protein [Shimia sp. SK013]
MTGNTEDTQLLLPPDLPPEMTAAIGAFALVRQMETRLDDAAFDTDLTKQERRMVLFLDPPRRMGVMAQIMGALPSSVTAMADALQERGLVVRERDPNDGRAWQLALTATGKAAREETMTKVAEQFRDISGMTPEEIETFGKLATKAFPLSVLAGIAMERDT